MPENLFNSAHKATNQASREGYDKVNWLKGLKNKYMAIYEGFTIYINGKELKCQTKK